MPTVTAKAKREAIAKAYGCPPVETDMDDVYYSRRKLAKVPDANGHGWHELKYQNEEADLADTVEKTLQAIRERDARDSKPKHSDSFRLTIYRRSRSLLEFATMSFRSRDLAARMARRARNARHG